MRKGVFGIPLYEIALVLVVAGIVLGALGWQVDYLLEQAEKAAVEATVMNMRSGLRLEKARRIVAGERLEDLAGMNPLDFVQMPSVGDCVGKMQKITKTKKPGGWLCENDKNTAVYVPLRARHLKIPQQDVDKQLIWQVQTKKSGGDAVELVLMTPYQWF